MRLRWTTPAANDLYNIVQHIQEDNPTAAAEVATVLYDGYGSLRDFPRRAARDGSKAPVNWSFPAFPTSLFTGFKMKS